MHICSSHDNTAWLTLDWIPGRALTFLTAGWVSASWMASRARLRLRIPPCRATLEGQYPSKEPVIHLVGFPMVLAISTWVLSWDLRIIGGLTAQFTIQICMNLWT